MYVPGDRHRQIRIVPLRCARISASCELITGQAVFNFTQSARWGIFSINADLIVIPVKILEFGQVLTALRLAHAQHSLAEHYTQGDVVG